MPRSLLRVNRVTEGGRVQSRDLLHLGRRVANRRRARRRHRQGTAAAASNSAGGEAGGALLPSDTASERASKAACSWPSTASTASTPGTVIVTAALRSSPGRRSRDIASITASSPRRCLRRVREREIAEGERVLDAEHLQLRRDLRPGFGGSAAHAERGGTDPDDHQGHRAPQHIAGPHARAAAR